MEFPAVLALDQVHFDLKSGEVHALIGENGAGKSTLMKILCGVYKMKSGSVEYKGQKIEIDSVQRAQDLGISIIYQELNLVPYLSVAENIFIGRQPIKNIGIDWNKMYAETQRIIDDLHVAISPRAIVKTLSVAQQQMVEVAKATSRNVEVLIMDEPTSALTRKEIDELFRLIDRLQKKGVGIIYISHRLEELNEVGDRATVLRDGKYVDTLSFEKGVDLDHLIRLMVGRDIKEKFPKEIVEIGEEALRVENISTRALLKNCSFSVRKGEILGVAGLLGAGRTELMRAITGVDRRQSGDIYIRGKKIQINKVQDAVDHRIGFLTEDRKGQGLIPAFSVTYNITLTCFEKFLKLGKLNLKKESQLSQQMVNVLQIKTPSLSQKVRLLSGGNQQKVVLAKWLLKECDIIIFDEPTRGIDVGAKFEIYKLIIDLARNGVAIIMVSSELPEILGMSDRIMVMSRGQIAGELTREEADQVKILQYATRRNE
jgi:ribose transport system ATP-binding protein